MNDQERHGLNAMLAKMPLLDMIEFTPGDQPIVKRERPYRAAEHYPDIDPDTATWIDKHVICTMDKPDLNDPDGRVWSALIDGILMMATPGPDGTVWVPVYVPEA